MKHVNYKFYHGQISFDNPLSLMMRNQTVLSEGLIKSYPVEMLRKYLINYFKLDDEQISTYVTDNGVEMGNIYIPNIDENLNIVEKALNLCGYYISTKEVFEHENNEWLDIQFEPRNQTDIREMVEEKYKYLIHITPSYNKEKILQQGFTPRSKNELFDYPSRVYFLFDRFPSSRLKFHLEAKHIGRQLSQANSSQGNNGEYTIFRIDISRIDKNIKFFSDPNFNEGIYVKENIRQDAIIDFEDIKFL